MGFRGLTINTEAEEAAQIYAENDAAIYQAILGDGDLLLNYGNCFAVDITGSYTVRVNSGLVAVQGHLGIIEVNDAQNLTVGNGTSGVTRSDLIVAEFKTTGNHGIDTFTLKVLKGGTDGSLPSVTAEDLNSGGMTRQFAIARITVTNLSITEAKVIQTPATCMKDLLRALNERISYGTSAPSGGKDGDIYIQYEA